MGEEPLTPDARTRAADLYEAYHVVVSRRLAARFPETDPQKIANAVVEAILQVSMHFERYDRERASMKTFLTAAAMRILQTQRRAEFRRRRREQQKAVDPVTAFDSAARSLLDELADREQAEQVRAALDLNSAEHAVFDLWLLGEKDLGAYAAALGLAGQPPEEQAATVRRVKGRIRQRLHRLRVRLRREDYEA